MNPDLDQHLQGRLDGLCQEGVEMAARFDEEVRSQQWHPFLPANYQVVLQALIQYRASDTRFLEWGSATGVITIMADLLGYEAFGIELDADLVETARELATRNDSKARFAAGSFLPTAYRWEPESGDGRMGTIGEGTAGYDELGHQLPEFDVVFAFPWDGEVDMMVDLMRTHGGKDATLLVNMANQGVHEYRGGERVLPAIA
ncbi:MAG: class I SAM-dependent methyltransferase [Gemmatimonadetes bacterium]|jgi:hypothetical protein|nr:class I SAM-dependent methyltransferase [Gemmatimonadota bacterium]MBT7858713.1 class I SAM-dependent methyltransferase [Gemmatimonadota bacterium]